MTELQEARKNGFHSAKEEEFTVQCDCCQWWYDPKNLTDGLCSPECIKECSDTEEQLKYTCYRKDCGNTWYRDLEKEYGEVEGECPKCESGHNMPEVL